jgi:hypothetical protein
VAMAEGRAARDVARRRLETRRGPHPLARRDLPGARAVGARGGPDAGTVRGMVSRNPGSRRAMAPSRARLGAREGGVGCWRPPAAARREAPPAGRTPGQAGARPHRPPARRAMRGDPGEPAHPCTSLSASAVAREGRARSPGPPRPSAPAWPRGPRRERLSGTTVLDRKPRTVTLTVECVKVRACPSGPCESSSGPGG